MNIKTILVRVSTLCAHNKLLELLESPPLNLELKSFYCRESTARFGFFQIPEQYLQTVLGIKGITKASPRYKYFEY